MHTPWLRLKRIALLAALFMGAAAVGTGSLLRAADPESPAAVVLDVKGAIGPATSRYLEKGLQEAQARGRSLVILQMDTPGGLDSSMRDIISAILASPVPVVTYVAPSGARAASAGTYILYASHVAAMSPATHLGAATPVAVGGGDQPSRRPLPGATPSPVPGRGDGDSNKAPPEANKQPSSTEPSTAMERKTVNDAVAYIRGLAELRGRNADWAEQAVRGAVTLTSSAAREQNVIDVIARDLPDLLAQLEGREVRVGEKTVKLATRNLVIEHHAPDWRTQLLSVLTNPTVAYGLLLIGIYGLMLEGYNPGAIVPGVVGVISLLFALFAFQILSVNYAGLALVVIGIGMIVAEFFVPSFGALGLGGLVAFVIGSIILLDTDIPGMDIGLPVVAAVATVGGLVIVAIAALAKRAINRPVTTGEEAMVGAHAESLESFTGKGRVRFGGEIWNAHSASAVSVGQTVRIVRVDGLSLWVEPI